MNKIISLAALLFVSAPYSRSGYEVVSPDGMVCGYCGRRCVRLSEPGFEYNLVDEGWSRWKEGDRNE